MDPSIITPFITSIQNVFSTMLQLPVEIGDPYVKKQADPSFDVSGIIGMSGDTVGSVVLSFPGATAERIVALFCGEELALGSGDFNDAIGELVNMVSGGAKALFPGKKISISVPSVVNGKGHTIATPSDAPVICIPCTTDCGELHIQIAIVDRQNAGAKGAAAHTARA